MAVIARTLSGKVPLTHAAGFYRHLLQTGVEEYRQHPDCSEVKLLRRDINGWAHFLLLSFWTSMETIRAFAGDQPEKAVLYPNDNAFGLIPDEIVTHYEVVPATPEHSEGSGESRESSRISRESHSSPRLATPVGVPSPHDCRGTRVAVGRTR
jgi:hypothetical protein